jgi:hypothetical protein
MKKHALGPLLFTLGLPVLAQQIAVETGVINIEVPVRAYQGARFLDDLKLEDFELLEDGKPVPLEAVYLVKKRSVERRDEVKRFAPRTNRSFYLFFEISEYAPKMGEALDFFIQTVIMPGDSLTVVTPLKTYRMKPKAFEVRTRAQIVEQITGILRKDSLLGSTSYRSVVADLEDLAKTIGASLSGSQDASAESLFISGSSITFKDFPVEDLLNRYADTLALLDDLRTVDQKRLLQFPQTLKDDTGQKYVYMFYQREFVPRIETRILYQYLDLYQDRPTINQTIQGIFEFYRREIPFDVEKVKQVYADASVAIHFLLITDPPKQTPGVVYQEHSEDIFGAFREMAKATGGFTESSANPAFLMKEAVESSENYYLLYYTPQSYTKDGKFRSIVVRVKRPGVRVVHRMGYFAN